MWKIKRTGKELLITSDGKQTVRKFLTEEQAIVQHDKLVKEHEEELASRAASRRRASDPRSPDLETAIVNDPENVSGYAVYADWLQSQGDPRGALMALQLSRPRTPERDKAIAAHLASNRAYLLGPLAVHRKQKVFGWELGYIHTVNLDRVEDGERADVLEQVLQHPSGRFVVYVVFNDDEEDVQPVVDVLVRHAPATLRSLHLVAKSGVDYHRLWPAVPRLRELSLVRSVGRIGPLDLPALESLRAIESADVITALAQANWPMLRRLEVDLPSNSDASFDELLSALHRELPRLETLVINNARDIGKLVRELPEMPFASQLVKLELQANRMTDAHALLAGHRDRFPRLVEIDVSRNHLTATGIAALGGLAKTVYSYNQR